jgi:hypothetical protein
MPSGIVNPGGTVQPAATSARRPTTTPSSTVAPLPTSARAWTVALWTTQRWPMVAPSPTSVMAHLTREFTAMIGVPPARYVHA